MIVIAPYAVQIPGDILSTNIPADVVPVWFSATRYPAGMAVSASGATWEAAYAVATPADPASTDPALYNEGHDPAAGHIVPAGYVNAGSLWWRNVSADAYFENRYRMFSDNPARTTESPTDILVEVRPDDQWSAIALFNVGADELTVEVIDGPSAYSVTQTLRYASPLSADYPNQSAVALLDLPAVDPLTHPNAYLRLCLHATAPRIIHCGCLVIGPQAIIGRTLYGTEVGIVDYSRKERDPFGNILVIERGYTDVVRYRFEIDTLTIAAARQFLAERRAKATVFIGATIAPETLCYGYYKDLLIPVERHSLSTADLEVESIVQDAPASTASLPTRAVFVEPDGTACIEADLGAVAELCIVNGKPEGTVRVTVLDRVLEPGETIVWSIEWLTGESDNEGSVTTLSTDCLQVLSLLTWPVGTRRTQAPAVAAIRATITLLDTTTITSEAAILTLKDCVDPCDCTPEIGIAAWYNDETGDYDLEAVAGVVLIQP